MKTTAKSVMVKTKDNEKVEREIRNEDGELKSRFFYKLLESGSIVWTPRVSKIVMELMRDRWRLKKDLQLARKMIAGLTDDYDLDPDLDSIEDLADKFGIKDDEPLYGIDLGWRETMKDLRLEQSELR